MKLDEFVRVVLPDDAGSWFVQERYFKESDYTEEYPGVTFEYAPNATGLDLAEIIAGELENANFHRMTGLPTTLWHACKDVAGEDAANKLLEKLYSDSVFDNL